jgi:hypothetical protein
MTAEIRGSAFVIAGAHMGMNLERASGSFNMMARTCQTVTPT